MYYRAAICKLKRIRYAAIPKMCVAALLPSAVHAVPRLLKSESMKGRDGACLDLRKRRVCIPRIFSIN